MLARTYSATQFQLDGAVIQVEAATQRALPQICITGLPGDIVRESKERVRSALLSLGFDIPSSRVVVHLSPAGIKKQGSQFDLAIALCILMAEGYLENISLSQSAFIGELSLDGKIHGVHNILSLAECLMNESKIKRVFIPLDNSTEVSLIQNDRVKYVEKLSDLIQYLQGKLDLKDHPVPIINKPESTENSRSCLDEIQSQNYAKRALAISLAGGHHLLMVGPPGVGKSMLAHSAPFLLPPLSVGEKTELTRYYGHMGYSIGWEKPFRSPHHSVSAAAFLGGGAGGIVPGEVTLAHHGILFLDELPEFRRDAIEGLREPLQSGKIYLHRVGHSLSLPAHFILIAAMNPCPCGYFMTGTCRCTWDKVIQYRKKISGPILDRIDLYVQMQQPKPNGKPTPPSLSHESLQKSVGRVIQIQLDRKTKEGNHKENLPNSDFGIVLGNGARQWFEQVSSREVISMRSLHKILNVSRTISDLDGEEQISINSLREAWGYRCQNSFFTVAKY